MNEEHISEKLQEISDEWFTRVHQLIAEGDQEQASELIIPVLVPLALVKMSMESEGAEWSLLEGCKRLSVDFIQSLDEVLIGESGGL